MVWLSAYETVVHEHRHLGHERVFVAGGFPVVYCIVSNLDAWGRPSGQDVASSGGVMSFGLSTVLF